MLSHSSMVKATVFQSQCWKQQSTKRIWTSTQRLVRVLRFSQLNRLETYEALT